MRCSSSQVNLEDTFLGSPGNSVVPKNKITVSVLMDYIQFLSQLENRMSVCDVFIKPGEFRGHFPWFSMKFNSIKKQNHCQCSDGLQTVLGSHGKSYEHICDVHPAIKLRLVFEYRHSVNVWMFTFSHRLSVSGQIFQPLPVDNLFSIELYTCVTVLMTVWLDLMSRSWDYQKVEMLVVEFHMLSS